MGIDKRAKLQYQGGMFRETLSQRSLFGVEYRMEEVKLERLEKSWAHAYRNAALPLIEEKRFAGFFDSDNGRPNKPVRMVVSVLLLKEIFNLTDREALEQLEWNTQWHYAMDLLPEAAHTCQKTLHNFRVHLLSDEGAGLFESTTAALIEAAGLRTGRQRQDSTHVISNIKVLTRLGLFVKTVEHFLEALRKEHPRLCGQVPEELRGRYLDREGYFADARSSEAPRRLEQAALDTHELVLRFEDHAVVRRMESFGLLRRLFEEQCEPPASQKPERIALIEKPSSASLQSPADPDVTYGHKGKGYEVQLTETCEEDNPFQVVTAVNVNGANESDQHHVLPQLEQVERTCGTVPEELHADAGYGSGDNIVQAKERGTELKAPIGSNGPESGIVLGDFAFDEAGQEVVHCPVGERPLAHKAGRGQVKLALFDPIVCAQCPLFSLCPTQSRGANRVLPFTLPDVAVARRRLEQETSAFKERHKIRSGIEATNSELKGCHGLGELPVRGKPRVALSVRLKVLGLNIKRYVRHLVDIATGVAEPVAVCA